MGHTVTPEPLPCFFFLGRQVTIYFSEMVCKHNLFKKQRTGVVQLKTNLNFASRF